VQLGWILHNLLTHSQYVFSVTPLLKNHKCFSFSMLFPFYRLCHKCSDTPSLFRSPVFHFSDHFSSRRTVFTFPACSIMNFVTPIYCLLHTVILNYLSTTYSSNYFFLDFFLIFLLFSSFFFFFLAFSFFLFFFLLFLPTIYIMYNSTFCTCNY
jgi:hypothetical protein